MRRVVRWAGRIAEDAPLRKRALILLGVATILLFALMALIDPSRSSRGPSVIGFELAGSRSRAAEIMAEWGADGRRAARLSLALDYAYLLAYGLLFALAAIAVRASGRARGRRRLTALGAIVPFLALAAAGFDAAENLGLLVTLAGSGGAVAPPAAAVCASVKFALIGVAILYVLSGLAAIVRDGRAPAR